MSDLLKQYSDEIGVNNELTLERLIESHRRLRELSLRTNEEVRQVMQTAREHAAKTAEEEVKSWGWFSRERLRDMKLSELVELLSED